MVVVVVVVGRYSYHFIMFSSSSPRGKKKIKNKEKVKKADLPLTSSLMEEYNKQMQETLRKQWVSIFKRIFQGKPPRSKGSNSGSGSTLDYDDAMREGYGVKVRSDCVGQDSL